MNQYDIDKNNLLTKRNEICPEGLFQSKIREEYIKVFLRFHDKHKFHNKEFNCSQYHCMKSAYQYHKLSAKHEKQIQLKYDHFKNRKLTKDSLIKEHLW